jgi:tetratricopeptide (TPR) repeat protein
MMVLNFKRMFVFTLLFLLTMGINAQQDKMFAAYTFLKSGDLDSAKFNIELVVLNTETANNVDAWSIRAFLYKEIYNKKEKLDVNSPSRIIALNSFKKILQLDPKQKVDGNTMQAIKYLVNTLNTNVVDNLDTINYNVAINVFENYKEYYPLVDTSSVNLQKRNNDFLMALASVYTEIYKANKTKIEFLTLEKNTLLKVLLNDPNNISVNYNLGILYYNQAVTLITQQDFDLDLVALSQIQDNSIILFKQALPFMEKANSLIDQSLSTQDPRRKETLRGLSGIYFSLNEPEMSNKFKQKLEELDNQK